MSQAALAPTVQSWWNGEMKAVLLILAFTFSVLSTPAVAQINFYVANGGVDTGSCQVSTAPCATLNYVTSQALQTPADGQIEVINMAAGSGWNESVAVTGSAPNDGTVGHNNQLIFDGGGPTTVWNGPTNSCGVLVANAGANVSVENMTMEAEGSTCQSVLFAQLGGLIQVYSGITFGPTYQQMMHAEGSGSQIEVWNSFNVAGGAGSLVGVISGALIEFNPTGIDVTFSGTSAFNGPLISASVNGIVYLGSGLTFSGAMSGQSYGVSLNATIFTDGAGCSIIPGSPGTSSSNGICQ